VKQAKDVAQGTGRWIAAVLDGASQTEAAKIGGWTGRRCEICVIWTVSSSAGMGPSFTVLARKPSAWHQAWEVHSVVR
jgi:hypothetical protein